MVGCRLRSRERARREARNLPPRSCKGRPLESINFHNCFNVFQEKAFHYLPPNSCDRHTNRAIMECDYARCATVSHVRSDHLECDRAISTLRFPYVIAPKGMCDRWCAKPQTFLIRSFFAGLRCWKPRMHISCCGTTFFVACVGQNHMSLNWCS